MNLLSVKTVKQLLLKYNAKPSKIMGQNFLTDKKILDKIIEAAELDTKDVVLEIGPGMGTLTKELSNKSKKVIAVEKDKTMLEILKETLKNNKNVEILQGDALRYGHQLEKYKIVANIPYYLTSPVIRKFLEEKNQPEFMVLMVQKEVAQRICAKPPHMNLLAVSVQFYAKPKIISYVSKKCFWPSPKVDSAIIKITSNSPRSSSGGAGKQQEARVDSEKFFKVVKAGFSHPRKQIVNNLSILKTLNGVKLDKYKTAEWLLKSNINLSQRAETLTIDDWVDLAANF